MKIQVEHGYKNEEVLYDNGWIFILGFATLLLIFFFFGITAGMLYALFIIAILVSESESVTINKRFKPLCVKRFGD